MYTLLTFAVHSLARMQLRERHLHENLLPQVLLSVYTAYLCSTLTRTNAVTRETPSGTAEHHDDDDDDAPIASLSLNMTFNASDRDAARKWMLNRFSNAHGGRCVCRNSSDSYVYCKCCQCQASCAAALCHSRQWRVSVLKSGANLPCVPSIPPCPTPSITVKPEDVPVPVALPKCDLCEDVCEVVVSCSKGHTIGVSCESSCFENYVLSCISGDSLMQFMDRGFVIRCPSCCLPENGLNTTPLDMQTNCSKLSKKGYAQYVKALAEQEVVAAVRIAVQEAQARMPSLDQVSSTLAAIFQPERCPHCDHPFEYNGGCTSMECRNCKTFFCLWCREKFKGSGEGHAHAWNCEKAPANHEMLTESRVFPSGHGSADLAAEFIHAYFKVRKLEMLQFQLQQGA